MALDAQNNWNVEMPQLKLALRPQSSTPRSSSLEPTQSAYMKTPTRTLVLPPEIITVIISLLPTHPTTQGTLWAASLVNRVWYSSSIAPLYAVPHLHGGNFHLFADTICPSKNSHIRYSALAPLVKCLDMGELVHNSSKSLTARLLGRLKGNIEEFVAPQASFAINSFAALSKCVRLRTLDLSLISASISNRQLFQTLAPLKNLEVLYFPRSSGGSANKGEENEYAWPPRLKTLHLAGGIDDHFLRQHLNRAPATLERLSIQHCSNVYAGSLLATLENLGNQLLHLTIRHPMSKLQVGVLDPILLMCPKLHVLRISADYISNDMFEFVPKGHPLRILDLDCSPQATADVCIDASAVLQAVDEEKLPDLRSVRASARLAWSATKTTRSNVIALVEVLEGGDAEEPLGIKPGVWIMND